MTETAKTATLLAAVCLVALALTLTDVLSPAGSPRATPTSTVSPSTTAAAPTTTTTIDPSALVPDYLRGVDGDLVFAPLPRPHLPPCTATEMTSTLAGVVVPSANPERRTFNLRVTNESATTCGIEVGLDVVVTTPDDESRPPLQVRRVNPPPGATTAFSFRDPVLEPGRSATFSVVATIAFEPTDEVVSTISIEGPSGLLADVPLPRLRIIDVETWSGPNSGSGRPLDPSSVLIPLPPADIAPCEAATTRARVPSEANLTGTSDAPLVVTSESDAACALPAGLTLRQTGIDARGIPRSAPASGTYAAPVIPAGGEVRFVIAGTGGAIVPPEQPDDRIDDVVLRFPNGDEVVVDVTLDPSHVAAFTWYGPIETPDDDGAE